MPRTPPPESFDDEGETVSLSDRRAAGAASAGDEATAVAAPGARQREASGAGKPSAGSRARGSSASLPGSKIGSAGSSKGSTRIGTTASPVEALRYEELGRTRIFLWIIVGLVTAFSAALPFFDGDPTAEKIFAAGLALAFASALFLLWDLRDPAHYTLSRLVLGGTTMAVCAFTGVLYFGIFSVAPAIFVLGVYYFSLGYSRTATSVVYGTCVLLQGGYSLLVITGEMPDYGLIRAGGMSILEQCLTQGLVQTLILGAFLMGRLSRRRTLEAVEELEQAVRQVAQREALLREARQDLDRALQVGGAGRYTDQRVGSFQLGPLIGRGGMGEVYEARHLESSEPAAVKLLHQQSLGNPEYVQRFLREAEAAASLDVPYVIRVLEVGSTESEVPYIAMERLRGHDLSHHLRKKRRLPIGKVITLVEQVGTGLTAAREAGIVHRDLKPQNLFLAEDHPGGPLWKILDFGVSKLASHHGTLTKGNIVGTPGYMAPEQARGDDVDYRADLYALAVIAYRALTGHPAFTGKDLPSTLYDVVYKMPTRPTLHADLPEDIDLVLAIGLAKRREDRFDSGTELALSLREAARGALDEEVRQRAFALLDRQPWRGVVGRIDH